MNRADQELVMRLYDGELPPAEARLVEERLLGDAEYRGVFEGIAQVGDVVRVLLESTAHEADGIVDNVMERIRAERRLQAGRRAPVTVRHLPPWAVAGSLAGAVALAAALLLLVRAGDGLPVVPPSSEAAALSAALPEAWLRPAVGAEAGPSTRIVDRLEAPTVAIEAVDFGALGGTIFLVGQEAAPVPVVWVVDEPTGARATMRPL